MYIYVYICILDDERGDEEAVLRRVGTRVLKHREREKENESEREREIWTCRSCSS